MDNKPAENQNKYDISKSNFFANIDGNTRKQEQNPQNQSSGIINIPNTNIQNIAISKSNFFPNQNINQVPQYNYYPPQNNTLLSKSNFFPSTYSNQTNTNIQYQNQQYNYPNISNFYPFPQKDTEIDTFGRDRPDHFSLKTKAFYSQLFAFQNPCFCEHKNF